MTLADTAQRDGASIAQSQQTLTRVGENRVSCAAFDHLINVPPPLRNRRVPDDLQDLIYVVRNLVNIHVVVGDSFLCPQHFLCDKVGQLVPKF